VIEQRAAAPAGVRGWLLVVVGLLLFWGPLNFAAGASNALAALAVRGLSLGLVLVLRLVVTSIGVAAGLALARRRPAAVNLARASIILSAATDLFVYVTPYVPNNRMPGDTPIYVAVSLSYWALLFVYLSRSARVRHTFG
jgi:hypothetical protein